MQQTANFLFLCVQKTQVFTAINYFVSFGKVFSSKCLTRVTLHIVRAFDNLFKALCTRAQPLCKRSAGTIHIIVKPATSPAGFTRVRLAEDD